MKRLIIALTLACASFIQLNLRADLISSDGPFTFIKVPTNVTEQVASEWTPGSDDWYIAQPSTSTTTNYVARTPRLDDTMLASFAATFDGFFEHLYYPTLSDTTNRWDAALYGPQDIPSRFWWQHPTSTSSYINLLDYQPLDYNYQKSITRRFLSAGNFKKLYNALLTLVDNGGQGVHAFPYRPYYCNNNSTDPRLFWSTTGKLPYNPSYPTTIEIFPEFDWTSSPTTIQSRDLWPFNCWTFGSFTLSPTAIAKSALLAVTPDSDTNTIARINALPGPVTFSGVWPNPLDAMLHENFPRMMPRPWEESYDPHKYDWTRRLTFDHIAYMNAIIALLDRTIYLPQLAIFPKYVTHSYSHRKAQHDFFGVCPCCKPSANRRYRSVSCRRRAPLLRVRSRSDP